MDRPAGRLVLDHTVPLRLDPEVYARLSLPRDLTPAEADRVCAFVQALVLERPAP